MKKKKLRRNKDDSRFTMPWHKTFEYILEELLPQEIFDIISEIEVGRLPLRIDFLVVKKIKEEKADLPEFFDFFNDYNYTVIEYKSPDDYFNFDDYLKLKAYSILYKIKSKVKEFDTIIRLGVFNNTSSDFFTLMAQHGYVTNLKAEGLYYVAHSPENSYLINIEDIEKKDKALLLNFLSKQQDKQQEAITQLHQHNLESLKNYIFNVVLRRYPMRHSEQDKKWMERAERTLEQYIQSLPLEVKLRGVKPEEVLKQIKPEDRLKGLEPEDRLKGLEPEDRLKGLELAEVFKQYKLEEIEAYFEMMKKSKL
jgi:hypothetical protein